MPISCLLTDFYLDFVFWQVHLWNTCVFLTNLLSVMMKLNECCKRRAIIPLWILIFLCLSNSLKEANTIYKQCMVCLEHHSNILPELTQTDTIPEGLSANLMCIRMLYQSNSLMILYAIRELFSPRDPYCTMLRSEWEIRDSYFFRKVCVKTGEQQRVWEDPVSLKTW